MKRSLMLLLLSLPLCGWSLESLVLTIQDEIRGGGTWGESVDEYKIYLFPDGLIARIDYRNLQANFPSTSVKVLRSASSLAWFYDRRLTGKESYKLERDGSNWVGTRTLPLNGTKGGTKSFRMYVKEESGGSRLWTTEQVSALLLPGHYLEESTEPIEGLEPQDTPLLYDLQGKTLQETYRGRVNAKTVYARVGNSVFASRLEEPDDSGWREMGRSTLTGRSIRAADPSINSVNWRILSTVIPYPVYLPFLLDWKF